MYENSFWSISNPENCDGKAIVQLDINKIIRELSIYLIELNYNEDIISYNYRINDSIMVKIKENNHDHHSSIKHFIIWIKISSDKYSKTIKCNCIRREFNHDPEKNPYYKFDFDNVIFDSRLVYLFMKNIDDIINYTDNLEKDYWTR